MTEGMVDAAEPLISRAQLRSRTRELATEIERLHPAGARSPLLIGVLKGSTMFLADLVRAARIDVSVDFMSITSYTEAAHSGVVRIVKDLEDDIGGRDVWIVEDIVDTGLTLTYLRKTLGERGPRSIRTVALLDRTARRIVPVPVELAGFEIPDVFVIGYGMDFMGRYRNVPELLAVRDVARLANSPGLLSEAVFGPAARSGAGE